MAEANTDLYRSQERIGPAPSTTAARFASVLARNLTTECSPTRAPDCFDTSLKAACSEPDDSISKALLRAGFQVWFAYFLALREGNAHGLDQLSPADFGFVTSEVSRVSPHQSTQKLFSFLFDSSRSKKRLEWLEAIDAQAPTSLEPLSSRPFKRARISHTQSQGAPMVNTEISHDRQLPAANTYNADDTGQPADANTFIALYGSIGFHHNPRTQAAWPAASNLGLVFPTPLTRIIVKADGKAWLKASFEDDLTRCELEFFIVTSGVQHVAKELFDVHIDTEGQQRGMRLKNDVFAQIGGGGGGTLILSGARLEKVKDMLGDQAVEAYQISPSRVEELNNGQIPITRCLSMEIWPDVDCPSRLRLRVEVGKLSSIAGSLWPGMLVN